MQVMSAVTAMQSAGHDKSHGTGSIVPAPSAGSGQALAKNARAGHPLFQNGKGKHGSPGHPPGAVDSQTAEEAKQGINIANNPVAANALIVTNAKNAENIGKVASGAISARDFVKHSTGVAEGVSRILAAKDVREGYQSAKELVHEWGSSTMQAYIRFALENF